MKKNTQSVTETSQCKTTECGWEKFYRLSTLAISFVHSASPTAEIYGNGRNQVAVNISIRMVDSDGTELAVPLTDLAEALYLCDYHTGEHIGTSWSYTLVENPYHNAIFPGAAVRSAEKSATVKQAVRNSDVTSVTLFISCSEICDGRLISVGIHIPGIGDFNTSRYGTTTINAPVGAAGSKFKNPSYVNITARQAINYCDRSNITTEYGGTVVLSESQHYTSRIMLTNYEHYDGIARRRIVSLKSAHGYPFVHHHISYPPIMSDEASTGTVNYWNMKGMRALAWGRTGLPCAVIGRQMPDSKFYAFFWFSRQNDITFDGSWFSERWTAGRYYKCNYRTRVSEKHIGDDEQGAATLLLYTFVCHEHNTGRLYWNNTYRNPEVSVTDTYGNTGVFRLTFSHTDPESVGIE